VSDQRFREAPPRTAEEEEAEQGVLPHRSPSALLELIGEAQLADDKKKRKQLADQINEILVAMRAPGNEAMEARTILTQLDLKTLDDLEDSKGRLCHTEAMETLLACGFPHALGVKPEDLSFHVDERQRLEKEQKGNHVLRWVNLGLLAGLPLLSLIGLFGTTYKHEIKSGIWGVAIVGISGWWLYIRRRKKKP
jgi:hypothetical protein